MSFVADIYARLFATKSHTHNISDTNNLQTTLNGKASSSHNHDSSYAAKSHTHSEYAASNHTHTKSQITDFPTIPATPSSYVSSKGSSTVTITGTASGSKTETVYWRVWSDGFIEQWGSVSCQTSINTQERSRHIVFAKSFSNTNYYISCHKCSTSASEWTPSECNGGFWGSTVNSIWVGGQSDFKNNDMILKWYACGY